MCIFSFHRFFGLITFLTGAVTVELGLGTYLQGSSDPYGTEERNLGVLSVLLWATIISTLSHSSFPKDRLKKYGESNESVERQPLINENF